MFLELNGVLKDDESKSVDCKYMKRLLCCGLYGIGVAEVVVMGV
jgi:hypothetical protein